MLLIFLGSFSPTCVLDGAGDFHCNSCETGYEGRYCEKCSLGYYGNPSKPGGKCKVCECNKSGALNNMCDTLTGKCECKTGFRGHLCDQCEDRHVLIADQCVCEYYGHTQFYYTSKVVCIYNNFCGRQCANSDSR